MLQLSIKKGEYKMKKFFNPLFDTIKEKVIASEPIESVANSALSPISKKPMVKVTCDGIPAFLDEDNRLVLPIVEK